MGIARSKLQLLVVISAASILTACQMVADYDDVFDQQITSTQKDVSTLINKIIDDPDPKNPAHTAETYAADKDSYTKIHTELDGLLVRAKAHGNNSPTIANVQKIQDLFKHFEDKQKDPSAPDHSITFISAQKDLINDGFAILLAQEVLKKGVTSTTASK